MNVASKRPAWFLLTQHWLSLLGCALLATAVISWLFVVPLQIRGHASNPYIGIVAFLILPLIFFTGLVLVPIGVYISKHRIREGFAQPAFDRRAALTRIAWFFGITTIFNILIGTQLTYRAGMRGVSCCAGSGRMGQQQSQRPTSTLSDCNRHRSEANPFRSCQ